MTKRIRTLGKFLLLILLAVFVAAFAFILLARSGYVWWATAIELVDTRHDYYAAATLEDLDVHRKAAAALSKGEIPEIDELFGTLSQDRIAPGDGLVLATRKHVDRPLAIIVDKPDYEYITIYIPDFVPANRNFEIGATTREPRILALYAEGVRDDFGAACIDYAQSGTVSIAPLPDGRIAVEGRLQFTPNHLFARRLIPCEPIEIEIDAVFEKAEPGNR